MFLPSDYSLMADNLRKMTQQAYKLTLFPPGNYNDLDQRARWQEWKPCLETEAQLWEQEGRFYTQQ